MITLVDLKRMEGYLQQEVPDLKIAFKDQSLYHKAIGLLLAPFNRNYLSTYTTTMGSTIYFPTQAFYEKNPEESSVVLAHEFVHVCDSKKDWYFKLAYMFPQVLVILPVLLYVVLAWPHAWILTLPFLGYITGALLCNQGYRKTGLAVIGGSLALFLVTGALLTKWLVLVLLGTAVVGPWPARWRVGYELRGYGMTIAIKEWYLESIPDSYLDWLVDHFTGPAYFYMCWDRDYIQRNLQATRQQAGQRALQSIRPYSIVYNFLYSHGLIHQNGG